MIVWTVMEGKWDPYLRAICKTKEIAETYVANELIGKDPVMYEGEFSIEDWDVLEKGE